MIAVKDKKNNDWILQNKETGDIIRFSFENKEPTTKAGFPTLVDLKITDFCSFGCKFCYQSSTKEGKHANLFPQYKDSAGFIELYELMTAFKDINVLEVVLGGGEPTLHPRIKDILINLKENFVVGITTKNFDLGHHDHFKEIIQNVDTIAISCNSASEVERAKVLYDDIFALSVIHKVKIPAIYIQNILGLTSMEVLKDFLESCKKHEFKNVTLLGYKDFGFGTKTKEKEFGSEWIDIVKKSGLNIGVDSVVVSRWKKELLENGIRKEFLVEGEGKFSMYVDMVEQTMAASSFTDKKTKLIKTHHSVSENLSKQILEVFQSY